MENKGDRRESGAGAVASALVPSGMTGVVTHILVYGRLPELDSQGRPREFYGRRVHDTCYRRAYYDAGLFVEAWDDEKAALLGVAGHALATNVRKRPEIDERIKRSAPGKVDKEGGDRT